MTSITAAREKGRNEPRAIGVIAWGPIDSLSNGYFIRVYKLVEIFTSILKKPVVVIEYTELPRDDFYSINVLDELHALRINVPGNEKKCKFKFLKYIRLFMYQFINMFRLRYLFRYIDVLVIGGVLFTPSLILVRIFRRNRRNRLVILADPHMLFFEREERRGRRLRSLLLRLIESFYMKNCNYVLSISYSMKNRIAESLALNASRIIIVPHLLPEKISSNIKCGETASGESLKIAFLGTYEADQNFEAAKFLITILPIVKRYSGRHVQLLLVGKISAERADLLRRLAERLGVSSDVILTGYVSDPAKVLCEAKVLLAPMFTMSGVSTKMLYYLRFRDKLIVASREAVEGLEHLVNKHGCVVVADGAIEFVRKLVEVIRHAEGACRER